MTSDSREVTRATIGMSPYDPMTFADVVVLIVGVAAIASSIPARRATRADPVEALRNE
jgi:ABC-type lipoprotein release transport system permease subunit